jgi:hypothetical protein
MNLEGRLTLFTIDCVGFSPNNIMLFSIKMAPLLLKNSWKISISVRERPHNTYAIFRDFWPPPFVTQNRTNPYMFTVERNKSLKLIFENITTTFLSLFYVHILSPIIGTLKIWSPFLLQLTTRVKFSLTQLNLNIGRCKKLCLVCEI